MYYTAEELRKARESVIMTAIDCGVPEAEVRTEMKKAMDAGRRDPDPTVQAKWATFRYKGPEPTPEEFIAWCARAVKDMCGGNA